MVWATHVCCTEKNVTFATCLTSQVEDIPMSKAEEYLLFIEPQNVPDNENSRCEREVAVRDQEDTITIWPDNKHDYWLIVCKDGSVIEVTTDGVSYGRAVLTPDEIKEAVKDHDLEWDWEESVEPFLK